MEEDFEYDALTLQAPKRARWYTRLWPACLRPGCLSRKRPQFPLYLIGYDPVGQFQRAASVGDVASVERFINFHGCPVNECDRRGRTPLHYACAHNHPDVVRLLLSHRANIDILDDEGCTPLIKATQRDNEECVSVLLTQDADPHLMDFSGNAALHHAVSRGNTAIASKLLEYNVDIEGKTEYGLTPYKLALYENQHHMAEFLIQNGANVHSVVQSKSVGTSTRELEQKMQENERCNNEAQCSKDLMPFGSSVTPPTQLKSILKKSVQLPAARGRMKHKFSLCVGISSKTRGQRKKKHVRFNNVLEVHDYTDPMPLCRLSEESDTSGSIREDEDSPSIIKETKEQIPHTDKKDRGKKMSLTSWKSEMNLSVYRETETVLDIPVKKTLQMTSPACHFDTLKPREHEGKKNSNKRLGTLVHTPNPCIHEAEVEEKKTEPFPNIPADPGIAVPQPTAHIGPTSSLCSGDRGEIVEAPKKKAFGTVHNTARDLKLFLLDLPLLLLIYLMWFLQIFFSMLAWIFQKIHQVVDKDYPGPPSNQKDEPVAADDD